MTSVPPEGLFYLERDMTGAEIHSLAGGTAAVYSTRCPGKETPNEDGAALIPVDEGSGLLVVADGVGGARAGQEAVGAAIGQLSAAMEEGRRESLPARTAILNGFENANRAVQELGIGAATTLAVVELQDNAVRPYHVGDSMILVIGNRGKVKLQTISHSPIGFAVEAGMIDEVEAMHHEDRHLISNAIGISDMRIDVGSTLKLAPRDTVLLASDGLFDNLHTEEIVERLRRGPLDAAAKLLAQEAARRMAAPDDTEPSKPDDLTFVVFRPGRRSR